MLVGSLSGRRELVLICPNTQRNRSRRAIAKWKVTKRISIVKLVLGVRNRSLGRSLENYRLRKCVKIKGRIGVN